MLHKEKTLIIFDSVSYFLPLINGRGVDAFPTFGKISLVERAIRKGLKILRLPQPPESLWYGDWKKRLERYDTVIIFATGNRKPLEYIRSKRPDARLILWYWNPACIVVSPDSLGEDLCEKWSFDTADCRQYGMKHNTTFYFNDIAHVDIEEDNDIFFVGLNKGRGEYLRQLERVFKEKGLKTLFHIVEHDQRGVPLKNSPKVLPYDKTLDMLSGSKAVLEIFQQRQFGQTLRPLEALFMKKKLITNDPNIVSYDYYHPDNIFVLGVDNMDNIKEFIEKPFYEMPSEVVQKYDFNNWLSRFFK